MCDNHPKCFILTFVSIIRQIFNNDKTKIVLPHFGLISPLSNRVEINMTRNGGISNTVNCEFCLYSKKSFEEHKASPN